MSLPEAYSNLGSSGLCRTQYFKDTLQFLKQNDWIFNFPNTDVLIEKIFDRIPSEWRSHLENLTCRELNEIPFGFSKENWPNTLKEFIDQVQRLKPHYQIFQPNNSEEILLPKSFSRGLNPKKQHEILRLAKIIHEHCKKEKITTIIDVGAGLGYLSHLLHQLYKYKIVAIESETIRYNSAVKRQNKYHLASKNSVRYFQHRVDKNSASAIDNFLQNWYDDSRVFNEPTCLIGLHACADLTVTAFDIFSQLPYIKMSIIMPCCYHKLEMKTFSEPDSDLTQTFKDSLKFSHESRNPEYFHNFPLSETLSQIYDGAEGWNFLKRSFLRIACQSSASVWREMSDEEHRQHSVSHMRRAVLQLYTMQENFALVKLKRKCMNRYTSSNCNFETYLTQLDQGYYLIPQNYVPCGSDGFFKAYDSDVTNVGDNNQCVVNKCVQDNRNYNSANNSAENVDSKIIAEKRSTFTCLEVKTALTELWEKYEPLCPMIEILTCLQNSVQSICENLILLDRVTYIEQNPSMKCCVEKVTQDDISPRCHAMIASKLSSAADSQY